MRNNDVIWRTIFPKFYPYWVINGEKRKYSLLVFHSFFSFTLIPQTPLVGTQILIYVARALSRYVDPVQMALIFLVHFFFTWHAHIFPPRKLNNGSVTLFVQTMSCLDPFLRYVNTNMLKHPTDCWFKFFVFEGVHLTLPPLIFPSK